MVDVLLGDVEVELWGLENGRPAGTLDTGRKAAAVAGHQHTVDDAGGEEGDQDGLHD